VTVQGGTGESGASVPALSWQVHAASAVGAAHVHDGRPNQDAVAHQLLTLPGGSALLVVAVADGHGDSRHFRSDRGAKMAVAAGISATRDWSAGLAGDPAEIKLSARRGLVPGVVARWNAAVAADLADDQFTAAERAVLADLALPPPTAYGSTLLIGAFTDRHAVFAQIGDGNVVAVLPDGGSLSPVPGDGGPDRSHTASLCQDDASAAFRIGVIQLAARPLFAALLATDGFGNAQVQDSWQAGVAADLASFGLDHDQDWFGSQVPGWAAQCASSAGSGDDSTIALVINSAVRPRHGLSGADPHTETIPAQTLPLPVTPPPPAGDGDRAQPDRVDRRYREPDERRPGWPRWPGSRRRASRGS
jgi:Protein phosphatase 2C